MFQREKEPIITDKKTLWNISATDIEGESQNLGDLAAGKKVILVVNVATNCGFTELNYKAMVEAMDKFG